jgi:hypothetical protein
MLSSDKKNLDLISRKYLDAVWKHGMIRRQDPVSRNLRPALKQFLLTKINVVHYIKARLVGARLFARFCEEVCYDKTSLLFYCESRRLSPGNSYTCFQTEK